MIHLVYLLSVIVPFGPIDGLADGFRGLQFFAVGVITWMIHSVYNGFVDVTYGMSLET